jgi:hypothetical protein
MDRGVPLLVLLSRFDWLCQIDITAQQYKLGPQAQYLVDRMVESEHVLLDAVNRLSEKMDSYDQRLSSLGSNLSKVQSHVDLSLRTIQVLQKEQVAILKSMNPSVTGGSSGSAGLQGLMGASPVELAPSAPTTPRSSSGDTLPAPQHHQFPVPNMYEMRIDAVGCLKWTFLALMGQMLVFGLISAQLIFNYMPFHMTLELQLHLCIWWIRHPIGFSPTNI